MKGRGRRLSRERVVLSVVLRALSGRDDEGPIGTLVGLTDARRHRWLSHQGPGTLHRHSRRGRLHVNRHDSGNEGETWHLDFSILCLHIALF